MSKGKGTSTKKKKRFACVILKNDESSTRIVMRKNNPTQKKEKLKFMKYCPILRRRILFVERGKERHLK